MSVVHKAMFAAEVSAKMSNCKKRQVAFVVFNKARILAVGYNMHDEDKPCKCVAGIHDPYVKHAEPSALNQDFDRNSNLRGALTYAPCIKCARIIVEHNIQTVFIKETKHTDGIDYLLKHGVSVQHTWLKPIDYYRQAYDHGVVAHG